MAKSSVKKYRKLLVPWSWWLPVKCAKHRNVWRTSRPYATEIRQVIRHVANSSSEYQHPYLARAYILKSGYIVVTSDRGLCGGLNINLFRSLLKFMQEQELKGAQSRRVCFNWA